MDEHQILAALVAADEAAKHRQTFTLFPVAGTHDWAFAGVVWPDDVRVPSANEIDDLADRGWVRINSRRGHQRSFAVTSEGRRANQLRGADAANALGAEYGGLPKSLVASEVGSMTPRSPEQRQGSTDGSRVPRPVTAAVSALAVVVAVIAIISAHAWVAGGAVACVLAIAVLHRHVWRWPPAAWAVVVVVAVTVTGGGAGWAIARALSSTSTQLSAGATTSTNAVPVGPGYAETAGGPAKTWSDYLDAGGHPGLTIQAYQTVKVACRVEGFRVPDGDTWWYRIASPPWNGRYYVSADAFYNNGQTSGPLQGTKFLDRTSPSARTGRDVASDQARWRLCFTATRTNQRSGQCIGQTAVSATNDQRWGLTVGRLLACHHDRQESGFRHVSSRTAPRLIRNAVVRVQRVCRCTYCRPWKDVAPRSDQSASWDGFPPPAGPRRRRAAPRRRRHGRRAGRGTLARAARDGEAPGDHLG
jgi:hypothetical protein